MADYREFLFFLVVFFLLRFCSKCQPEACPESSEKCPVGLVTDLCGCCTQGVCGVVEGEKCYNVSLEPTLPAENKKYGLCGNNLHCLLRPDLSFRSMATGASPSASLVSAGSIFYGQPLSEECDHQKLTAYHSRKAPFTFPSLPQPPYITMPQNEPSYTLLPLARLCWTAFHFTPSPSLRHTLLQWDTVDSHVHRKTSAEQKRGHVTSSKPITIFLPLSVQAVPLKCQLISTSPALPKMFGKGKPIISQEQPSQISAHAHLSTHALYSQKQADSFVGRWEEI
uniref:IGFBP N-terminal domain-containing protein n=1 Tax=Timema douglasi TaxID=61478 RepID=A0A7R8Z6V7_TIMDO|nr:unnamed protein product [Timema douglasi]